jgi:dTDP-4-amino-4,6-dideoxy-D-galactose acyltransferase
MRIGRVNSTKLTAALVSGVEAWAQSNAIDCLYLLAEPDPATMHLAGDAGFRFIDIRSTFEVELSQGQIGRSEKGCPIRVATLDDVPELRRIAGESHHQTRFYVDGNFPLNACDELYRIWIERSCKEPCLGSTVLVAEEDSRAIGYISCSLSTNFGEIGLVGVDSIYQGRGWGERLVRRALLWFRNRGAARAIVVTQGSNVSAQRLYERCGFLVSSVRLWYHRWF